MLNKNIVNFISCDAEYDEAEIILLVRPSIQPHPTGREPVLVAMRYAANLMAWKPTVPIRTEI